MSFHLSIREENDKALIQNENFIGRTDSEVPAEDALNRIKISSDRPTGVLPPVVRYISPTGRYILLERPPQVIQFNYYGKMKNSIDEATLQTYDLPLPWTVYAIGLDSLYRPYFTFVYATRRSILSVRDYLYILPVTNCESNGKFCTPDPEWENDEAWSISEGINAAYSNIWSSNFNTDIVANVVSAYRNKLPLPIFDGKGERKPVAKNARPKPSNLFKRWEEFTVEETTKWDWEPARAPSGESPATVYSLINFLRGSEGAINSNYMYNSIRQRLLM